MIVIAVAPTEAFFIHRPRVQRFLGIEADGIANVHLWRPRGGSVKGTIASSVLPAAALIAVAV